MFSQFDLVAQALFSLLMWSVIIIAYHQLSKRDQPSDDSDEDGGLPVSGDSYPVKTPPSVVVRLPSYDKDRDRVPAS